MERSNSRRPGAATRPDSVRPARRRFGVVAVAVTVLVTTLALSDGVASAARSDTKSKPVIFVHGFALDGTTNGYNCGAYWNATMSELRNQGYTGTFHTWGYYRYDSNCYATLAGTTATSLRYISQQLAWFIWNNFTSKGRVVDIVAHSMGGLIARAAISGVQRHLAGYPSTWLYVEDVVTLGTPHGGSPIASFCSNTIAVQQCNDMSVGSTFMTDLRNYGQNPQGANGGTDWSLIASLADPVVWGGGIAMAAGHKYQYTLAGGIDHMELITLRSGGYGVDWWHTYPTVRSGYSAGERAPNFVVANALYLSSW